MSNALKIAAYFLGTVLLGTLLAPPLFWAGHALGTAWGPLHKLADFEFRRYFDRAMFVAALVLLWPTVRLLHIGGWRDLGLAPDPRRWQHLAIGFVTAGGLLWLLGLAMWWAGIYVPRSAHEISWKSLAATAVTAAAVACAEEGFFRGALLGIVSRTTSALNAIVFVSALFAVLHFLRPPEQAVAFGKVSWLSGFTYLPEVFWQWADLRLVLGGLLTLFAVGAVLGYSRWRTRALWSPIGLHAGWVFALKSYSAASRHAARNNIWFGEDLRHGLVPVAVVALTGVLIAAWLRREERASDSGSSSGSSEPI